MIPGKRPSAAGTERTPLFWVSGRQEAMRTGGGRDAVPPPVGQDAAEAGGGREAVSPDGEFEIPEENREGWLQYQENGLLVRIYLHEGITKVGRSKRMDYSVNGPTVSRAHAEFVRRDHHYYVRDTNSTCGTYLNGSTERIDGNREFELHPKDEIRLGNVKMTFLLPDADRMLAAARA